MSDQPSQSGQIYESEIYQRGLRYERPTLTFQALEWEPQACARLSAEAKGYVYGSAGMRETSNKNREAFKKWSIVPRRLTAQREGEGHGGGFPVLKKRIFGEDLELPIALAPVGVLRIFNTEGEVAVAKAAAEVGVPYILSTAASSSIEEAATASGGGKRWFQLYWPSNQDHDITVSLLKRAKDAGYTTLFVTLDTYILGWRPSDMDNGYNPFLKADKIGVALGFSDPVWRRKFKEKHGVEIEQDEGKAAREWTKTIFPGINHAWEDVKYLQEHWDGPIVLKGIQTIQDAKKAVEIGVQGIVVSNHGGRQQDGGCSSLGMLPHIVDAAGDKLTIFFDSGVRCGADIVKALALGADCVLIGRPYVYGLALGGQEGVEHVLKSLVGELELTLHLAGIQSAELKDLNRGCLVKEEDLFEGVKGIGIH
ncbi:FMN dependent dehydrogenase [Delitschia confertaspora ATCC 74209]|uniref:FMN dependent dehydrogenase n=1 Tax=Delitschia confertaspora ATCC 74209 TaxID=1513339 RepID=A0A9P4JJB6_9PLEO|nr:FMN dependent dehydrogenase [Delitschia confertaspora ATCC 74209]